MGLDRRVINEIMLRGDEFLKNGDPKIALNFYREASYMFPGSAICYIREAQSLIALVSVVNVCVCLEGLCVCVCRDLKHNFNVILEFF